MPNDLREQLIRDEGVIPHCYFDHLGYATIGVGHLIDERRGGSLPKFLIDALLDYDIDKCRKELAAALHWYVKLDEARQGVLINMAFNLGVDGLLKFKNTLGFVQAGQYGEAAANMLASLWAKQVGPRAHRLATQMETGKWT